MSCKSIRKFWQLINFLPALNWLKVGCSAEDDGAYTEKRGPQLFSVSCNWLLVGHVAVARNMVVDRVIVECQVDDNHFSRCRHLWDNSSHWGDWAETWFLSLTMPSARSIKLSLKWANIILGRAAGQDFWPPRLLKREIVEVKEEFKTISLYSIQTCSKCTIISVLDGGVIASTYLACHRYIWGKTRRNATEIKTPVTHRDSPVSYTW